MTLSPGKGTDINNTWMYGSIRNVWCIHLINSMKDVFTERNIWMGINAADNVLSLVPYFLSSVTTGSMPYQIMGFNYCLLPYVFTGEICKIDWAMLMLYLSYQHLTLFFYYENVCMYISMYFIQLQYTKDKDKDKALFYIGFKNNKH